MKKPKRMDRYEAGFYRGFAMAVADLIVTFDQPTMAADLMIRHGINPKLLREAKVEPSEMRPLVKVWRERGR